MPFLDRLSVKQLLALHIAGCFGFGALMFVATIVGLMP